MTSPLRTPTSIIFTAITNNVITITNMTVAEHMTPNSEEKTPRN
jgi:hypothetical protein